MAPPSIAVPAIAPGPGFTHMDFTSMRQRKWKKNKKCAKDWAVG